MLVVEGRGDETLLSAICQHGEQQIFPAGTRSLVEQLLRHLKREPIDGCDCVFLVDCDGQGKTVSLAAESDLLVTETCDMEADLVRLGVATRVARQYVQSDEIAQNIVQRACEVAMPISIVRRAAHSASVSMKRDGRQIRLAFLPDLQISAWETAPPDPNDVCAVIATELDWSPEQLESVRRHIPDVPEEFSETCLGKDVLDALHRILRDEGTGEIRGWGVNHFHRAVFESLILDDLNHWEVGKRLRAWQDAKRRSLLKD